MAHSVMEVPTDGRLKIGIDLLIAETTMAAETPGWADTRAMAQTIEAVGFDSIWVPDHFLLPTDFWRSDGDKPSSIGTWES
jgi:alkanesulfonate monooxygenase SsuD/methylene tetrahydromethanopterin reductase-like flavin-dependent oxidoreductase (luciferase family)